MLACSARESRVQHDLPYDGAVPWPNVRPTYTVAPQALAIVTNNASDTLSLLDLDKNMVVASPPIDVDPVGNDGPHHAAIDRTAQFVFTPLAFPAPAVDTGPHASHGSSALPGILVKLSLKDFSRVGSVTVFNNPGDVAVTPDGGRVLVSHFDLKRAIDAAKAGKPVSDMRAPFAIVDATTMEIIGQPTPCVAAHGIAVSADGKTAYLACYGEDAIAVVHLDDAKFASELWPIGSTPALPPSVTYGPYFVSVAPGGKNLVVSETDGRELRLIDMTTHKTTATLDTRAAAYGPASSADGAVWIVPTQSPDAVILVDGKTFTQTKSRPLTSDECGKPHQVARRGNRWFLVCEGDHVKAGKILEIDSTTLATIRTFDVGAYPDVIAFVPEVP